MARDQSLTVNVGVRDRSSAGLRQMADEALKLANVELDAARKMEAASAAAGKGKLLQLSASKQVALAQKAEAAGTDPLKLKLVALERTYAELTLRMHAAAKAGREIPPSMLAAADAAKRAMRAMVPPPAVKAAPSQLGKLIPVLGTLTAGYLSLAAVPRIVGQLGGFLMEQVAAGAELADMADRLGVSFDSLQQDAVRLGVAMSGQTARDARMAAQAISDFDIAAKGLKTTLAKDALPALADLARTGTEITTWLASPEVGPTYVKGVFIGVKNALIGLTGPVGQLAAAYLSLRDVDEEALEIHRLVAQGRAIADADLAKAEEEEEKRKKRLIELVKERKKEERDAAEEQKRMIEEYGRKREAEEREREREIDEYARKRAAETKDAQRDFAQVAAEKIRGEEAAAKAAANAAARAAADIAAANKATSDSYMTTAGDVGQIFGQMFSSIAAGQATAEQAVGKALVGIAQKAVEAGTQWILVEAAKAAAAAYAANAGIPFVGLIVGAAAAAAAGAAVMGLLGSIQMAEGGLVKGGVPGRDSVPAWLTPGEVVWPVQMVQAMERLAKGQGGGVAPGQYQSGGRIQQMQRSGGDTFVLRTDPLTLPEVDRVVRDRYQPSARRMARRGIRG